MQIGVIGATGTIGSQVVSEEAAVALVDEAELPRFVQRRFRVGY
jgi:putative NADH-flavin reductase